MGPAPGRPAPQALHATKQGAATSALQPGPRDSLDDLAAAELPDVSAATTLRTRYLTLCSPDGQRASPGAALSVGVAVQMEQRHRVQIMLADVTEQVMTGAVLRRLQCLTGALE